MSPLNPPLAATLREQSTKRPSSESRGYITGFQTISPRFRSTQSALLEWLADAHAALGGIGRAEIESLFSRYSGLPDQIAYRSHELQDFNHRDWGMMRLFGTGGSDISAKTQFFTEAATSVFERLYPAEAAAPGSIVHVTCTGYSAPSAAQRLVSLRGWGRQTQIIHAYHMGCYAAHPALRIGAGQLTLGLEESAAVDIVHTELCSLHLDPTRHDPAQLVIQSLFADGYIKYQLARCRPYEEASLEILALHDEIIPDSLDAMNWTTGPMVFAMTLSKAVPTLLAKALPAFVERLFSQAGLDLAAEKEKAVFAIHPGGPRIIEFSQQILNLRPDQVALSRRILREHGNMSSATLPHIWELILQDNGVPEGTLIASLGAGPGLTISGALFRKRK